MQTLCPPRRLAVAAILLAATVASGQPAHPALPTLPATTTAQPTPATATRRVAIFIKNRGGEALVSQRPVFEDLLVAQLTAQGFEIISSEDITAAVQTFSGGAVKADTPGTSAPAPTPSLDALLKQNTSALRLAQNLHADYLLIGSLDSLDETTQHLQRPDLNIDRRVTTHKLLTTYKILDAGRGGSLFSGTASARSRTMQSNTLNGSAHAFSDLLEDAAAQVSEQLAAHGKANAIPERTLADARVGLTVTCAVQDLSVPEVVKDDQGNYVLTGNRYHLEPLSVTVELDGLTLGSAPGNFQVLPGIHTLRLTREKFEPWERTINVYDGQTLQVSLAMTAQGRAEWQATAALYEELKQSARSAEDRAKVAEGIATTLKQSGYRVDTQEGTTVEQNIIENLQKAQ